MKLFLDRNKTLLPRLDIIYLLSRAGVLLGMVWYAFSNDYFHTDAAITIGLISTFALHLAFFYTGVQGRFDIKLGYLSAIIYDMILIPTTIASSGGMHSSAFLLFLMTISVAAYVTRFWFATTVTSLVSVLYVVAVWNDLSLGSAFDIGMRIGSFFVYYLAISYASDHLRKSGSRLLKLFDTLNKRTSELEKSQAQLEMIYENSRILASILETDGVIKEIMRIMGSVMRFSHFAIILKDSKGQFVYRSRCVGGRENYHMKAVSLESMSLIGKVCEQDEPVRIKDILGRDDFQPLNPDTRSIMVVPMNAHGGVGGVLTVESAEIDEFGDRGLRMLSVVARSAALALENAELHKRTEELTIIDGLTGAYNYRYFIQKLQEEKRRASRYNLPLSLIMVDIDWFKKLNDTYGHEAGNVVLARLASIINGCIRDVDIFVRYGGEEFVIILPQTPQHEACVIGGRIRERVEQTVIDAGKRGKLKITVSVGVTSFPENGKPQEELVSLADKALYQAKDEGRNAVCVV